LHRQAIGASVVELADPSYGYGQVFQAAPTYSYAPPTVTVIPNVVFSRIRSWVERTWLDRRSLLTKRSPVLCDEAEVTPTKSA
jgi:hypothetical protein